MVVDHSGPDTYSGLPDAWGAQRIGPPMRQRRCRKHRQQISGIPERQGDKRDAEIEMPWRQ